MPTPFIEPVTLEGEVARLVPLEADHAPGLAAACADGRLWELFFTSVPAPGAMERYVDNAIERRDALGEHPFAEIGRAHV